MPVVVAISQETVYDPRRQIFIYQLAGFISFLKPYAKFIHMQGAIPLTLQLNPL